MLFTIFIIVAILLGLALVGLGINILFRKNGKFPETHIGKKQSHERPGNSLCQHHRPPRPAKL